MGLLKSHLDAVETQLLATSQVPANSGHSLHKGTPREAFIKQFLEDHLSQEVSVGTGEIVDADSQAGVSRNQIDIVIYRRNYPRIYFGGGINAFLVESVAATIEVKSTLTQDELAKSIRAARNVKALKRSLVQSFQAGYHPPAVLSYVVAYDGPASMKTVHSWLGPIHATENILIPTLPISEQDRVAVASPTIDGIFVLGRGFVAFDNTPIGFLTEPIRRQHPTTRWTIGEADRGSLLWLFSLLTIGISGVRGAWLNPIPYLTDFAVKNLSVGA